VFPWVFCPQLLARRMNVTDNREYGVVRNCTKTSRLEYSCQRKSSVRARRCVLRTASTGRTNTTDGSIEHLIDRMPPVIHHFNSFTEAARSLHALALSLTHTDVAKTMPTSIILLSYKGENGRHFTMLNRLRRIIA